MPMHEWTRVADGIFHAFHHDWITELSRALNSGLLPEDYYALPQQQAAGLGPDVLTLQRHIHLLLLDPFPPGPRDPHGIHGAIWEQVNDQSFELPEDKPLTLVAYECDLTTRAYIEPVAVGDSLPPMPLFLAPGAHVLVPLEAAYQTAFAGMPRRWRSVLEH